MAWQWTPYTIPLLAAAAILTACALYVFVRRRHVASSRLGVLIMLATSGWLIGQALELSSARLESAVFWDKAQFVGICIVPTAWLVYALTYTGQQRWPMRRILILLSVVPITTFVLVVTNEAHGLIWSRVSLESDGAFMVKRDTYGPALWLYLVYAHATVVAGICVLYRALTQSRRLYRWQASALLFPPIVASLSSLVSDVFGLSPFAGADLTPVALCLTVPAVAWGLHRLRRADILPVAREAVVDGMADAVIVLDPQSRVVDMNPEAQRLLGVGLAKAVGEPVEAVFPEWETQIRNSPGEGEPAREVVLTREQSRGTYDVRISSLSDWRGNVMSQVVALRDISDRKRAEEEHKQSEAKMRDILHSSPDAITITDLEGTVIQCNEQTLRLHGFSSEQELIGKNAFDLIAEPYHESAKANLLKVLEQGVQKNLEYTFLTREGREFPAELSANVIRDAAGEPVAFVAITKDITQRRKAQQELREHRDHLEHLVRERTAQLEANNEQLTREIAEHQRAERALRHSEERLTTLFELAPDAYYLNDLKGNFTDGNRAAEELIGYARGELIGGNFLKLKVLPANQIPKAARLLAKNALGQPTGPDEFVLRRKNGEQVPVEIRTIPVKIQDQVQVLGIAHDISERKRAEEALRRAHNELEMRVRERTAELQQANEALRAEIVERERAEAALRESEEKYRLHFENISDVLYSIDREFRILSVSPSVKRHLGYEPEELVGKRFPLLKILAPQHLPAAFSDIRRVLSGECVDSARYDFVAKDGTRIIGEVSGAPLVQDGKVIAVASVARDVTERVRAEERIKASLQEKEVLLKEIHHRVKNNLQVIASLLYLQSKRIKDRDALQMFQESRNRVKSMALVHERLYGSEDLARIDFAEYLRDLTAFVLRSYAVSSDSIKLDIKADDVSLGVDTAIPCGLIISELVSNSLKHAFPDGRRGNVQIDFYQTNGHLNLTVSDDGVGLPPDLDFRNTQSLGLQLVNTLVDQLEGDIEMNGTGGTSIKITFAQAPL